MPLYDFKCVACGTQFEAHMPYGQLPSCPSCAAPDAERVLSSFAGPFTIGLRGAAARRSNAVRRAREEQRGERREQRRQREKD
jgi:putative FmdB family regulatory protein